MRKRGSMLCVLALAGVTIVSVTGCASMFCGSKQTISITSEPSDAELIITDASNGMEMWNTNTPTVVELDRGDGFFRGAKYKVEINKPGYESETLMVSSELNGGWYLVGNFFSWGVLGWLIIDPATGAMWTLEPDEVFVELPEKRPR